MAQVWAFILAHEAVFAGFGVALLDLVFALNPAWESNGIFHFIYVQLKSLSAPKPPAS